jgi:uncharacterized membrane protein
MDKGRLEAFSDGVIATLITIMVLGLVAPEDASLDALRPLLPTFFSYIISFIFLGIYWNNHHHLLQVSERVDGRILWANLLLLFWLSLIPFGTEWLGKTSLSAWPVACYGVILLAAAGSFNLLVRALIAQHGKESTLAVAVGQDFKGKITLVIYSVAILLAFLNAWLAYSLYIVVALIWLVPDPRVENKVAS